jgi:hypothetical protein
LSFMRVSGSYNADMLEVRVVPLGLLLALSLGCTKGPASSPPPDEPVACTMDAKVCPDGSAVGREGPNCEFAPCPGETPE